MRAASRSLAWLQPKKPSSTRWLTSCAANSPGQERLALAARASYGASRRSEQNSSNASFAEPWSTSRRYFSRDRTGRRGSARDRDCHASTQIECTSDRGRARRAPAVERGRNSAARPGRAVAADRDGAEGRIRAARLRPAAVSRRWESRVLELQRRRLESHPLEAGTEASTRQGPGRARGSVGSVGAVRPMRRWDLKIVYLIFYTPWFVFDGFRYGWRSVLTRVAAIWREPW